MAALRKWVREFREPGEPEMSWGRLPGLELPDLPTETGLVPLGVLSGGALGLFAEEAMAALR